MKITKSKLAQIVQEELAAVKAEGYKAYNRDDDERIKPKKRTLSRHAQELADRTRKGKSIKNKKAHLDAAQDSAEKLGLSGGLDEDGSGYSWDSRGAPEPEPTIDEIAQDSGVQEMIYSEIENNLENGPLSLDNILTLTQPTADDAYAELEDMWEEILEAAIEEMELAEEIIRVQDWNDPSSLPRWTI